jgi:hypothetical protein
MGIEGWRGQGYEEVVDGGTVYRIHGEEWGE